MRVEFQDERQVVFDRYRKTYVALTPEEWVRQHFAWYLNEVLNYPRSLTQTEVSIKRYGFQRRCDIVVYDKDVQPILIVECKAPDISLTDKTLHQAATYNSVLQAPLLIISNGLDHFCLRLEDGKYSFLDSIPAFGDS
ncbi:MAG: type I restriction enzyme HsdR N-terminal domain-containing protein [Calditrichota bacterium]